ncbi:MAG: alkaline phosphatase [Aquabacterium sp.]|jgi:alkaline phosphatase|uniref:alkaline phosphatase n=1 Tax=Aquabacterium sp. TaxID=1872578 RepID=UPI002A35C624|nr:alkaline phosphatase [Aquabacterium sp.]MDX9842734.1 alkaline phosphatase [Aquabacterium sp.]
MRTRFSHFLLTIALGAALAACGHAPVPQAEASSSPPVRNVIFMMSDGTPNEAWALTRWIKGTRLASDDILTGAVQTYGADSIITDSAPGGTAFATGHKGTDKGIAVSPWRVTIAGVNANPDQAYAPLPTVLEGARLTGRATGLVATANIQHASPASFSAHTHDRSRYADIGEQQVYQHIDVVLAGGEQYLLPMADGRGVRQDNEDLVKVLRDKGYDYVRTRAQMRAATGAKLFGMFAADDMVYDLDRARFEPDQPSLAEMTRKAIEVLSRSEKGQRHGFFLFVEGSKVDWAAHANDPSGVLSDLSAYDEAVKVALDFARADGQTLVISTSDHGNGGLTIGRREAAKYATTDDDSLVAPLRRAQLTGEGLARLMAQDKSEAHIRDVLARHWGIEDLSAQEVQGIQTAPPQSWLQYVLGPMLSSRAGVGWTTNGHTGGDPFLYSFGPGRVSGLWENTGLAHHMARVMGFELKALQERLFVEAVPALSALGLQVELDRTQAANPLLRVRNRQGDEVRLPIHKNELLLADRTHELEGIVVLAEQTGKVYVPRQAITLIRASLLP